eukprot:2530586-Alexandrium_andersonii.AAC.1
MAVARRPFGDRRSREGLRSLASAPWVWRAEPARSDVGPQVIPRTPQEAAPPAPGARAAQAPR